VLLQFGNKHKFSKRHEKRHTKFSKTTRKKTHKIFKNDTKKDTQNFYVFYIYKMPARKQRRPTHNLTKKQLTNAIKAYKKQQCPPYSKLNKQQLFKLAKRLNIIEKTR